MTLVVARGLDGPRVHVLAIGVGGYRHLFGGSDPVRHGTYGLGQLSGPPHSATAFVEWVVSTMRHPTAELGTIELLLSPGGPTTVAGQACDVDLPTLANTKAAFDDWYARCHADPGNVALFYFSGHGVQRENQFLLLEDFGAVEHRMLENAVDIDSTYFGMAANKAAYQYFFVDACREIPYDLVANMSGSPTPLAEPKLIGDRRSDKALLKATSGGQKAYGRKNQATRFTNALLKALDGQGAERRGGVWQVGLSRVGPAIEWILRQERGAPPQQPEFRGSFAAALHQLAAAPSVPVVIHCDPAAAAQTADASLTSITVPGAGALAPERQDRGWRCIAPADTYRLSLGFPANDFKPCDHPLTVVPPGVEEPVKVEAR